MVIPFISISYHKSYTVYPILYINTDLQIVKTCYYTHITWWTQMKRNSRLSKKLSLGKSMMNQEYWMWKCKTLSTFYHMLKTTIAINTGQSHTVFTVLSNIKNLCSSFATPRSECSFAGWRSVPGSSDLEYSKGSERKPDGIPGHLGPEGGGLPDAGPFTTDTKFHFRRLSRYVD